MQQTFDYKMPVFRVTLVREGTQKIADREQCTRPEVAAKVFADYLDGADREHFCLLFLDTKNRVIGIHTVSIGVLDSALVSPREVFKAALLANAATIILAHNHPSGDCTPSDADRRVTDILVQAGKLLDVDVLDHVVIGEYGTFCSMKKEGYM